jgi:replicative DNA helicase
MNHNPEIYEADTPRFSIRAMLAQPKRYKDLLRTQISCMDVLEELADMAEEDKRIERQHRLGLGRLADAKKRKMANIAATEPREAMQDRVNTVPMLEFLRLRGPCQLHELELGLGLTMSMVHVRLRRLVRDGKVYRIRAGKYGVK